MALPGSGADDAVLPSAAPPACVAAVRASPCPTLAEPKKPKGKSSAYNLFFKLSRQKLVEARPELAASMTETTKAIAEQWHNLGVEERVPYVEMAAADAVRHELDMEEFRSQQRQRDEEQLARYGQAATQFRALAPQPTVVGGAAQPLGLPTTGAASPPATATAAAAPRRDPEGRWEDLLCGVARSEAAFGKRRKLSRTDPAAVRAQVWQHRGVLTPGIRQPLDAQATPAGQSGSTGEARPSDAALLRGMLCELLLWCAPSETPAAIMRSVTARRSPAVEELQVGNLELSDFVTVSVSFPPTAGWTAVVPLSFWQDERQQRLQWSRLTAQQNASGCVEEVAWIPKASRAQPALRGCGAAPRTLAALSAAAKTEAATATTAGAGAGDAASSAPAEEERAEGQDVGQSSCGEEEDGGLRANELLHGYLRGLALADGLHKGAQEMLLHVCDCIRGASTAVAATKKLRDAGKEPPVPKDEMAAAFHWIYSGGLTAEAGMVEHQGQRYVPKGRLITAMTPHPELHAKYIIRHAVKRQYLSSWAKGNVEHCMRVEIYPWLTATFENKNANNEWVQLLDEADPLVDLLSARLKENEKKKSGVAIKWWYRILKSAGETSSSRLDKQLPGSGAGRADPTQMAPAGGAGGAGGGGAMGLPKQLTHVGPRPPAREPSAAEIVAARPAEQQSLSTGDLSAPHLGSEASASAGGASAADEPPLDHTSEELEPSEAVELQGQEMDADDVAEAGQSAAGEETEQLMAGGGGEGEEAAGQSMVFT